MSETASPAAPARPAPTADAAGATGGGDAVVRRVVSLAEYHECVAIQRETWGADFNECVPATILQVAQKLGGVVAAAFAADGGANARMLGFVFGLAGVVDGRPAHWSDMLAVRAEARGAGVGERLKRFQRALARAAGAEAMYWTFDPLVARNAHLNVARLGARVVDYVPNMYGDGTGSPLHGGLPTDRLVARWDLTSDGGPAAAATPPDSSPDPSAVRIPVPLDFHALAPEQRAHWRAATREAFLDALGRGYAVTAFHRAAGAEPPYYELRRAPAPDELRRAPAPDELRRAPAPDELRRVPSSDEPPR